MYTIAIVDDYALIRDAFSDMFQSLGFTVLFSAANGKELLHHLAQDNTRPQLVFMDINMPVMDGIAATAIVSADYPSIKVIGLSGFCNEKHIIDMLKNGAQGFITKNAQRDEVMQAAQLVMNDEKYLSDKTLNELNIPLQYLRKNNTKRYKTNLLNEREYEFLSYCATDLGYKEIASRMSVQYKTVDTYRASVSQKLNIHTRAGLAVYAVEKGISKKQ
jgi:two-component system, NarL family, invasion response regulator UvrY